MVSMRKLMVLVVVAALLAWFFARVLFGAIGYGGILSTPARGDPRPC